MITPAIILAIVVFILLTGLRIAKNINVALSFVSAAISVSVDRACTGLFRSGSSVR